MPETATAVASAPPAHFYVPEGARFTIADEIADLMVDLGYQVEEPERLACRALYAQQANGDWIGLESGIAAGRQNIKTATMVAGAIHDLWVQDVPKVNWTAHEFKTSTLTFQDEFKRLVEEHSWLSRRVKKIRESHVSMGIDLVNGAKLNFLARSKRSGRGMGTHRLYGDEALFWTDMQLGAIVPTMSARRNAHLVHGGSPGMLASEPWRNLRDRGRSRLDPYLGWIEWGSERKPCLREDCTHAPGSDGCQLDDEHVWWLGNPALDRRITRDYVRQERLSLPVAEFMRERCAWWEDPPNASTRPRIIDMERWAELATETIVADGARVAVGIDKSWDRKRTWVATAAKLPDERIVVQVVNPTRIPKADPDASQERAYPAGDGWVKERLKQLREKWNPVASGAQDGNVPVASVAEDLKGTEDFDGWFRILTFQELGMAYGTFLEAVKAGTVVHIGQQQLTGAIDAAVERKLGEVTVPDRLNSEMDIAPLIAVIEAHHLLLTVEPAPKPEAYVPYRIRRRR